jgi:hypothetical protein
MVFVPANFWTNTWFNINNLTPAQRSAATNLCGEQLSGYTFVALGAVGDQPGRHTWHYFEPWRALPDGSFIALQKFGSTNTIASYKVTPFNYTNNIPFPTVDGPSAALPFVAFNYLGQLTDDGQNPAVADEYIPLARGTVFPAMDPSTKALQFGLPSVSEIPPGNSTNSAYTLVDIDPLTGRATLRFQKVQ